MAGAKKAAKKRTSARPPKRANATKTRGARKRAQADPAKKAAAEKIAETAKAHDAVGSKLTVAQRQLRDSAVVARAAAGATQQEIAIEFGITDRQVRRVLDEKAQMPSGLDERPMALLEELLRGFRADIADGEAMAAAFAELHPAAAIGAKRLARESRMAYAELLQALGKLPNNLELFRSEAQMQRIAESMVGHLEGLARGETKPEEALSFFRSLLPDQQAQLAA